MDKGHTERLVNENKGCNAMFTARAKYHIGQVVRHRKHPFRGVIFDVDPRFANT